MPGRSLTFVVNAPRGDTWRVVVSVERTEAGTSSCLDAPAISSNAGRVMFGGGRVR